jgi:dTDP-4-dehydrorhamnose reductase
MRFAVIGDLGMLGSEMSLLLRNQGEQVQGFNRRNLQLSSSPKELAAAISGADVLVNCVAYTNVDGAEKDWELANLVNGEYAGKLAETAAVLGAKMIQISTDYVFAGASGSAAKTSDPVNPVNAYGRSKALGEERVIASGAKFQIFRTAWLYGSMGACFPKSIAGKLLSSGAVKVVDDQFGQPTWTKDLCKVIYDHSLHDYSEPVVHAVSSGSTDWFNFAKAVADALPEPARYEVSAISSAELHQSATRPAYSVLENSQTTGPVIGEWLQRWKAASSEIVDSVNQIV